MRSVYGFVVAPKGERYNNVKKVGENELILNSEIYNHQFINRQAVVKSIPIATQSDIEVGDTVIVHHNVFRRWHNQRGIEMNSSSYFNEENYIVFSDQIFAIKKGDKWKPLDGYCFIQPLKEDNKLLNQKEKLMGIVRYTDGTVKNDQVVGFKEQGKFEFVIDEQRLYRVKSNLITTIYEHQGNEEKYNPSWAQSS
jgi:hypothetical protein|tara:strand:- start:892 stop:1479 length:588 start_codon:yes stop_codon:yes gene_type:complete